MELGVDVFKMDSPKCAIHGRKFDVVVFNFPNTGCGIADRDRNAFSNQQLIAAYLTNAQRYLATAESEVHITVKRGNCQAIGW